MVAQRALPEIERIYQNLKHKEQSKYQAIVEHNLSLYLVVHGILSSKIYVVRLA